MSFHTPTFCPPGQDGAPADALEQIALHDARAADMCSFAELAVRLEPAARAAGTQGPARRAYETNFGLPPQDAVGRSYNRLTGQTSRDIEEVIATELALVGLRVGSLRQVFAHQTTHLGPLDLNCDTALAFAGHGAGGITLCPGYWNTDTVPAGADPHAVVLVHESTHVVDPNIGDTNFGAPNVNFFMADR